MKTITVVIPLYNEEKRIQKTIKALNKFASPKGLTISKVIFVNDGSTDKTVKILENANFKYPAEILSYKTNRGRGFAVKMGVKKATTDYIMYIDGDYSIPLENLKSFNKHIQKGIDLIVGSKKLPNTKCLVKRGVIREFIGSGHTFIFNALLGVGVSDYQGGFKIFTREIARAVFPKLRQERWGLDAELLYVAKEMGYAIKELPVVWSHISTSSKVNLARDVFRALADVATIRISGILGKYSPVSYSEQLVPRIRFIPIL
ncbi:glycosyltransferase [Patescibacteria group bacterium]|nr:glycosyltransferase [Patescibacteria group bacterium]